MAKLILTHADPIKKIASIKTVRAATGLGLRESKDAVDSVVANGNPYVIASELSIHEAREKLILLEADGYNSGRVEYDRYDERSQDVELTLRLADAIALARSTEWSPSQIINKVCSELP